MKKDFHKKLDGWPAITIGIVAFSVLAYFAHDSYVNMAEERANLLTELELARESSFNLMQIIDEREETINNFQGQINTILGTVGTLEKLSKTDEELLAKYSKVYFLNENYVPAKLIEIEDIFLNDQATNDEIHTQVWPHLERLLIAGDKADMDLLVASAYRSFQTQSALKSSYTVTYGSGANRFSADQGYSEHQLGTAVDFTTKKLGSNFSAFASTPAYKWLLSNAHHYGFVLSYPEGNAYYKFEPWHWRFVGVNLASRLHDDGFHFYDMDQREIDTYLIKLFD